MFFVFFDFCSTEVTVAEDSDDEFAYEEVRYYYSTWGIHVLSLHVNVGTGC